MSSADSIDWALPSRGPRDLALVAIVALSVVGVIGALDVSSGNELMLSPLYLIVVITSTWRGGRRLGLGLALASALVTFVSDLLVSEPYLHLLENSYTSLWIPIANAIARAFVFVAAALAVSKLQDLLRERDKVARELEQALGQIRTLESLLPVCAWCKRIRDDGDRSEWKSIEHYIVEHTDTRFTHGMCPECFEQVWKEEGLAE